MLLRGITVHLEKLGERFAPDERYAMPRLN